MSTDAERRTRMVKVRFTPTEEQVLREQAGSRGITVSEYIRGCALERQLVLATPAAEPEPLELTREAAEDTP